MALAELCKPLIGREASPEEMAETVLEQARLLTGSTWGCVCSIDPDTGARTVQAVAGFDRAGSPLRLNAAARELPRLPLHDLRRPRFTNSLARTSAHGDRRTERYLSVPVLLQDRLVGQIELADASRHYTERDLEAIQRLATLYALALERREFHDQTVAALREKEVLLREVHHRVKNNLQVISSLLNLQTASVGDEQAVEILRESQNRVRSMAMVHEQLHRSRDLSRIDFGEYVRNLAASLFSSYGIDSSKVALRLNLGAAWFPIDTAIACGLIVQELVSNSLKHAFPGDRKGGIRIDLRLTPPKRWQLVVADDGVGLPGHIKPEDGASLGLKLVRILADQLDAAVACSSDQGTEFRIVFPAGDP